MSKKYIKSVWADDLFKTPYTSLASSSIDELNQALLRSKLNQHPSSPLTNESETITSLLQSQQGTPNNDTLKGGAGDDELFAGDGDDKVYGNDGNDSLFGEAGNDVLHGNLGDDLIDGGLGNDKLYGHGGNNTLIGGLGDDVLVGLDGNDLLEGGDGNDILKTGNGDNTAYGHEGKDRLVGGNGNDTLHAGSGNDLVKSGHGNDIVYGEEGNDRLISSDGNDIIHGGSGNDYIKAGNGDDTIFGDEGNDRLIGENGNDIMDGGAGDDYILSGKGDDVVYDSEGKDTIKLGDGDDTLIYDVANHASSATEYFSGEAGYDILKLTVDAALANESWFQDMLSDFESFVASGSTAKFDFSNYDPQESYLQFSAQRFEEIQLDINTPEEPATRYDGLLDGSGQTVVVIDTGVDYYLDALGGGLGSDYRVVGGYDFVDSDDDPDEGTHWHGTHVASIIGSSGEKSLGWAPNVDIISLRVFDNEGSGRYTRIEQSLDWVVEHFDDFENPITAINMSFSGSWGMTEQFSFLNENNVFMAASAGNNFNGIKGVNNPAASPYTVAVGAHSSSGKLWGKSNRDDDMLTAEGVKVSAYVPLHKRTDSEGNETVENHTGTSMAAPQVAGASIVLRELMETIAREDVNQTDLYNAMFDNATLKYDSVTDTTYRNLDMEQVIAAVTPEDDFLNTIDNAESIGLALDGLSLEGFIEAYLIHDTKNNGRILGIEDYDKDYLSFTASSTGSIEIKSTATGFTHADLEWLEMDIDNYTIEDDTLTFAVTEGVDYTIGVTSSKAMGYYTLEFSYTDDSNVVSEEAIESEIMIA